MMVIARHQLLAPCSALASARSCGPTSARGWGSGPGPWRRRCGLGRTGVFGAAWRAGWVKPRGTPWGNTWAEPAAQNPPYLAGQYCQVLLHGSAPAAWRS